MGKSFLIGKGRLLGLLFGMALLAGCTTIQLISFHDEETERLATELQNDFTTFFVEYEAFQTGSEKAFSAHQKFYRDATIKLSALQVRADAIYKNDITSEQVDLLEQNLAYLALLHKNCVTATLTEPQRESVRTNGVDVTDDCRVSHGASTEIQDRGDQTLNTALLPVLRTQFDQSLSAIIRLELAKRRGEKED